MNEFEIGEMVFKVISNAQKEVRIWRFIDYKLQHSS